MIEGADHMYAGQEDRVAQVTASWADTLLPANTEKSEVPKTPKANLLWWTKEFERQLHFGITIRQIMTFWVVGFSPAI